MPKTMEEIRETALRDWEKKHNSDVNWMKSRIDGAWRSGYTNAIEQMKEIVEAAKREAYDKGYNDGFECGQHETTTLEYQKGLKDAWEAARKLETMQRYQIDELFPEAGDIAFICNEYSVETVIEKLKAYEGQKKAEEEAEIKAGDVLQHKADHTTKIAVTGIHDRDMISGICVGNSCENALGASFTNRNPAYWEKTGHHFPQVAEILKAMKEEDDG